MSMSLASIPRRVFRLIRLAVHAAKAWWIVHVHFPRADEAVKHAHMKRWSRHLMRVLGIRIQIVDAPASLYHATVVVGNHVSWLDIFLIYTEAPGLFVAKSEIRAWPIIGGVIDRVGTLFIERGSPRHARTINSQIVESIAAGRVLCLFPEGETSLGDSLLPFHAALLQPAIEARAKLFPVALRYKDADGRLCTAASYAGDTTLLRSLWQIVSQRTLIAELHFLDPVDAADADRRTLARNLESVIAERLGVPVSRRRSERLGGPPDA